MEYQLVFQFKGSMVLDFDSIIMLEENLQRIVEPVAEVDGHDIGRGEVNIFVLTSDPASTFERARKLLSALSLLNKVGIAYRELASDMYTVMWPERATEVFSVG